MIILRIHFLESETKSRQSEADVNSKSVTANNKAQGQSTSRQGGNMDQSE